MAQVIFHTLAYEAPRAPLGGDPQPTGPSPSTGRYYSACLVQGETMTAASSSASQPGLQVNASQLDVTEVWSRIHKFGRFPKRLMDPQSEDEHQEQKLWAFVYNAKKHGIPDDIWQEMRE